MKKFLIFLIGLACCGVCAAQEQTEADNLYASLLVAAAQGNVQQTRRLIAQGADVNQLEIDEEFPDYYHKTPLMLASQNGHLSVVKELIKAGADVNQTRRRFADCEEPAMNALDFACPDHMDVAITLAKAGIDPQSVLFCACNSGNRKLLKIALKNGAQVDINYGQGFSPLMLAARNGHKALVQALIKHGADVNYMNDDYGEPYSVLDAAQKYPKIVQLLKSAGAKQ